jgi:hypothetical protein
MKTWSQQWNARRHAPRATRASPRRPRTSSRGSWTHRAHTTRSPSSTQSRVAGSSRITSTTPSSQERRINPRREDHPPTMTTAQGLCTQVKMV